MKKIFRVIYPFFIYFGITNILVLIFMTGYTLNRIVFNRGASPMDVYLDSIETVVSQSLFLTAAAAVISVAVLWLFYVQDCHMRGTVWKDVKKIPSVWPFVVILGIAACIAGNNLLELSHLADYFKGFDEIADLIYNGSVFTQILCVGIVIPAAEEMAFRILGFRRLRDYTGFWTAALISSLAFGVFHGNMVQGVYAFLLGMVICYAYERQDNPVVPYLFHASANVISVVLAALPQQISVPGTAVMVAETIIAIAVAVFCMKKMNQSIKTPDGGLEEVNQ